MNLKSKFKTKLETKSNSFLFILVALFLMLIAFFYFGVNGNSEIAIGNMTKSEYLKLQNEENKLTTKIKNIKLNRIASQLKIPSLHLKYPKIIDYKVIYLTKRTIFFDNTIKKRRLLKQGTRLVKIIRVKKDNVYFYKNSLLFEIKKANK